VVLMRPDAHRSSRPERLPRRGTDRAEDVVAWVLTAAALVLIVVAGVTGIAVHGQEAERVLLESASRTQVRAVLLEDAPVVSGEYRDRGITVRAEAGWTNRDGTQRTGEVIVRRSASAGETVDVWEDRSGAIVPAPTRSANAVVAGVLAALGVLLAGGTILAAAWYAIRILIAAGNSRRWEREWARVGPVWNRDLL
jgi:hypothetical protein